MENLARGLLSSLRVITVVLLLFGLAGAASKYFIDPSISLYLALGIPAFFIAGVFGSSYLLEKRLVTLSTAVSGLFLLIFASLIWAWR